MMTAGLEAAVRSVLSGVTIGENGPDIVSAGLVHDVVVTGNAVRVLLDLAAIPDSDPEPLVEALTPLLKLVPGVERAVIKPRPEALVGTKRPDGIRTVLAVHSGKGGVGKSTIAANLAVALARDGLRVGLLDADVYGPSAPVLFGVKGRIEEVGGKMLPKSAHGVSLMSLGFLMPPEKALAWRGSLVDEGLPQLLTDVAWSELDILIVDLPPGTGDVHLAIARAAQPSGVLTVTTPGAISVQDVQRGMEMFADMAIACLGIVENMASVSCGKCGHVEPLFGGGGGAALSEHTGLPLLASIPFVPELARSSDAGAPYVVAAPHSVPARMLVELAATISDRLQLGREEVMA